MWGSKIKKKKVQFILMAILLFVTSLILSTCLSITVMVKDYVKDYYKDINNIFMFNYDDDQTKSIVDYLDIKGMTPDESTGYNINKNVYLNNNNMNISLGFIVAIDDIHKSPWDITIVDGENVKAPGHNEIWVQKIMADSEDIKLGDMIRIKVNDEYSQFKVTALINDSLEPSSIVGFNNFYISTKDKDQMKGLVKQNIISFNSKGSTSDTIQNIKDYLGTSLRGDIILKDSISGAATTTSSTVGGIGLIASILIFIAAIIIIRFILWNNILKEYKYIGIYKAIGFSTSQIKNIYIRAYGSVGIVAIILGSLFSFKIAGGFVRSIVKYIGSSSGRFDGEMGGITIIVGIILVMSLVYIISLSLLLKRISKVNPVQALMVGTTTSIKKLKPSMIKNTINPFMLAINDIFKYKKQNLIIGIVFSLVSFLSLFFVNIDYSVANINKNVPIWFGIMLGDINIDSSDSSTKYKTIVDYAENDSRVSGVRYGCYGEKNIISIDTKKYGIKHEQVVYYAYNNYEESDRFVSSIINGRNPEKANEVALSQSVLSDSKLKVGDYITLKVDNEDKKFLITGSYTSIYNATYSFRVILDAIPKESVDKLNIRVLINFRNKDDKQEFISDIQKKYNSLIIEEVPAEIENGLSDLKIVSPITKLILVSIILFSLLNIINVIVMNNADNRRKYGIMKAIGFSSKSIIERTVYRFALISFISMIIGFILNITFSSIIFKSAVMGIDGLINSNIRNAISILLIYVLINLASIISMISIKQISTVELMEE